MALLVLVPFRWSDNKMQKVKVKEGRGTQSSLFTLFPCLEQVISREGACPTAELCPQSSSWKRHEQRRVEGDV